MPSAGINWGLIVDVLGLDFEFIVTCLFRDFKGDRMGTISNWELTGN